MIFELVGNVIGAALGVGLYYAVKTWRANRIAKLDSAPHRQ